MKLYSSAQFNPNFDNLSAILKNYSLTLDKFELATSGIANCTIFVETNNGKFVLRVYRQDKKTEEEIELEARFVAYLHEQGIPVAVPIGNRSGDPITRLREVDKVWHAILMPMLKGTHAEEYSDKHITSLAELQAKMHVLARDFNHPTGTAWLKELREGHFIRLISDRNALDPARAGFINRAEAYVVKIDENLPSGLCHLDYDNGNVLTIDGDIVAVLDFDDLEYSPFVRCLAYTIWDIVFERGIPVIHNYVSAYERYRSLSADEHDMLIPITLFRHYIIGCKDVADNQMNDDLLRRYLELEQELLALMPAKNN